MLCHCTTALVICSSRAYSQLWGQLLHSMSRKETRSDVEPNADLAKKHRCREEDDSGCGGIGKITGAVAR